jgi:hypothetical protein
MTGDRATVGGSAISAESETSICHLQLMKRRVSLLLQAALHHSVVVVIGCLEEAAEYTRVLALQGVRWSDHPVAYREKCCRKDTVYSPIVAAGFFESRVLLQVEHSPSP